MYRRKTHKRSNLRRRLSRRRRVRRQRGGSEHGVQFRVDINASGVSVAEHAQDLIMKFKNDISELIQEGDINDSDITKVEFSYMPQINQFQMRVESTYQGNNANFVIKDNINTMFEAMEDSSILINGVEYDIEITRL